MDIRFDGKVAVVTGASSGIGKATALEFAKSGANVVVHYNSNKDGAAMVVAEITKMGQKAIAIGGDLATKANADKLIDESLKFFGTIDILVNNAGTLVERRAIETMDEQLWDKVMDINLKSAFLCCNAVIPSMKKKGWGAELSMSLRLPQEMAEDLVLVIIPQPRLVY